jgi:hypothetical protein
MNQSMTVPSDHIKRIVCQMPLRHLKQSWVQSLVRSRIFIWLLRKRGYDTTDLIERGAVLFPDDLDIEQGARCLAFELPTAAGFHFHRANESVLHRYYDAVTNGKPRLSGWNIGEYLAAFKAHQVGDPLVLSALKDLKDLHRNPLIHPEHTLESVDQAIALLGSIQCVVVYMLKAIPLPPAKTT